MANFVWLLNSFISRRGLRESPFVAAPRPTAYALPRFLAADAGNVNRQCKNSPEFRQNE